MIQPGNDQLCGRDRFSVCWFRKIGSTNAALADWCRLHPETDSGLVYAAWEQNNGRGRQGRRWVSAPGCNLCFSLFIRTDVPMQRIPSLNMAVSLGIADALARHGVDATVKWPNDLLCGGRKICGILSERGAAGVVIGAGINVNKTAQECARIDQPATSVLVETGKESRLNLLLDEVLGCMAPRIEVWQQGGFAAFRDEYLDRCGGIGIPVKVRDGAVRIEGTLSGFGEFGQLFIRLPDGVEREVWAGDLEYGPEETIC